ncbi:hypothetical protein LINPERHAP2_LOCUS17167 [Linum perenne]
MGIGALFFFRAAMADELEDGAPGNRVLHIKKRSLRNKSLAVSFNEKDLKDYVNGFHKRKKKRRKEAHKQQDEALRRKRIELRKKRRLEDGVYPNEGAEQASEEGVKDDVDDDDAGDTQPTSSVAGTTMYDNGDLKVTVTTSEISREVDNEPQESLARATVLPKKNQKLSVSKRQPSFKKSSNRKPRVKTQTKRDKRKAKQTDRRR